MKNLLLCLLFLIAPTALALADDVYPNGIGDFADGTTKSRADWDALYGDCDPNKEPAAGSVCAPAAAAWEGLSTIDSICTDYDQDGVCVAADQLDGMYGDTSVSEPLAVSCQRGAANPPQEASCLIEGGTSQLKRRSTTTCGAWSACHCSSAGGHYPVQDRQCCTTTTFSSFPGLVITTCVQQTSSCWRGRETWPCP